jgi:anti-sigma regulatory factor (Ser/Thr protein kinase)
LPLGVLPGAAFDRSVQLVGAAPGDRVFLCTDGVTETRDATGAMFGEERLEQGIQRCRRAAGAFDCIIQELTAFRAGAPQQDDTTLVEIVCAPACATAAATGAPAAARDWQARFEFGPQTLRAVDPLPALVQLLTELDALPEHRERVYMIVAELFNNALEHGLLRLDSALKSGSQGFAEYYARRAAALAALDSGYIRVSLRHTYRPAGGRIVIEVEDSGAGFDPAGLGGARGAAGAYAGRGLVLVRSLCQELHYHGRGNRVEAVYEWR